MLIHQEQGFFIGQRQGSPSESSIQLAGSSHKPKLARHVRPSINSGP